MITAVARLWMILRRRLVKKKSRHSIGSHITLNNCLPFKKTDYLRRKINIGHLDDMIVLYYFERFYDNHRRLLSKNYYFR